MPNDRMSLLQTETAGDDSGAPDPLPPTHGGAHTHPANSWYVDHKTSLSIAQRKPGKK